MEHGPSFINNENIYEITVGIDPKNDMRFTVGKTYMKGTPNQMTVTHIAFDQNMLVNYGSTRAIVYAVDGEGVEKQWKDFVSVPVSITSKV